MVYLPEHAMYKKSGLPDQFWDIQPTPQFKNITNARSQIQTGKVQAQVFNSLLSNPRQLTSLPRRWRLAAYSTPAEYSILTLAAIVKESIRAGIRTVCCPVEKLYAIPSFGVDLVFCYNCFSDLEPSHLKQLRDAHFKNWHLMYSMDGSFSEAQKIIKLTPDFVFEVHQATLSLTTAIKL